MTDSKQNQSVHPNDELIRNIRVTTNVIPEHEYRELFQGVAQVVSEIVSKTLGPYGSTTIIDDGTGFSYPTKDGWSCMQRLRFNDPLYQTIFSIIKQVSFNSVSTVGDGTTTAMVATSAFLNHMMDELKTTRGGRQADFIASMQSAADAITDALRRNPNVKHIDTDGDMSDIYEVAKIATNGNETFSKMLQDIYQRTHNPNIRIEIDGGAGFTTYEIEQGYRFDCDVVDYMDYRNADNNQIKIDTATQIMILDHNVTYSMHKDLIRVLSNLAQQNGTNMILMAPYFDDIVSASIGQQVNEMVRRGVYPNIMLVQIPMVSKLHQQSIVDLTTLTGALTCTQSDMKAFNAFLYNAQHPESEWVETDLLASPQYGKFSDATQLINSLLGKVSKITFTGSTAYLQDYEQNYNKTKYENMVYECRESYQAAIKKASKTINGNLDKDFLFIQNRYIRLMGNNAIIRVGGASDIQKRCDKDALDDAILACRSAYEYGYVRGLNLEILRVTAELLDTMEDSLEKTCVGLFKSAFADVFTMVINNRLHETNPDFGLLMGSLIESNSSYNLISESPEADGHWTVINSVQTDIEIINAMTSILTTMMTSSQFLSMLRQGDFDESDRRKFEKKLEEERQMAKARAMGLKESGALKDIQLWNFDSVPVNPILEKNPIIGGDPYGSTVDIIYTKSANEDTRTSYMTSDDPKTIHMDPVDPLK